MNNIEAKNLIAGQTFLYNGAGPYVATRVRTGAAVSVISYRTPTSKNEFEFNCRPLSTLTLIEN